MRISGILTTLALVLCTLVLLGGRGAIAQESETPNSQILVQELGEKLNQAFQGKENRSKAVLKLLKDLSETDDNLLNMIARGDVDVVKVEIKTFQSNPDPDKPNQKIDDDHLAIDYLNESVKRMGLSGPDKGIQFISVPVPADESMNPRAQPALSKFKSQARDLATGYLLPFGLAAFACGAEYLTDSGEYTGKVLQSFAIKSAALGTVVLALELQFRKFSTAWGKFFESTSIFGWTPKFPSYVHPLIQKNAVRFSKGWFINFAYGAIVVASTLGIDTVLTQYVGYPSSIKGGYSPATELSKSLVNGFLFTGTITLLQAYYQDAVNKGLLSGRARFVNEAKLVTSANFLRKLAWFGVGASGEIKGHIVNALTLLGGIFYTLPQIKEREYYEPARQLLFKKRLYEKNGREVVYDAEEQLILDVFRKDRKSEACKLGLSATT